MNIQMLLTGNELMVGDIVDSNSAMIAQELKNFGIELTRKVCVSDDLKQLINEIQAMSLAADILIVNGGLGPTVDDLTAEALAQAANLPITEHPQALAHLKEWSVRRAYPLNKPNLKQALLPQGCDIIANRNGSAVGFSLTLNDCEIYCTPGVPHELKVMFKEEILPKIKARIPEGNETHVTRLQVFGLGESTLQKLVDEQLPDWPKNIEIGFRASMPILEVKLTSRDQTSMAIKPIWLAKLSALLGDHIIAEIADSPKKLAEYVIDLLKNQQKKITTAESCTGGLIASQITEIAGSSHVFDVGFVTYSNAIKTSLLNVDEDILSEKGAVSEETVLAMAKGALEKSNADYVIAVSGVAGPSGGTEDKPVGTVWVAWGTKECLQSQCLYLPGTRKYIQHYASAASLDLIRRQLIKSTEVPHYLLEKQKR